MQRGLDLITTSKKIYFDFSVRPTSKLASAENGLGAAEGAVARVYRRRLITQLPATKIIILQREAPLGAAIQW